MLPIFWRETARSDLRRIDRAPSLREIVAHPNYIILYRVTADRIEVVNVVHARRPVPRQVKSLT